VASIARRPDGTYRPRYRDENGKEHARHFKRKADAQRWLDEVTASVVTGSYVDPQAGRATFDAYYRAWSERQVWAPMTEVQMDLVRRKVTFGAVPMAALRASHLETWVKAMVSDGYAPNTVATRVNAVRAALKSAVRDRVIAIDPSAGLRLPARRRAEHAMEIPTPDQVRTLIDRSRPNMQAYLGVCAFAGLRLGEASAVNLEDVDFLGRRLQVHRQVQRRRGGPAELRQPKYGSERTIYLPNRLVELLARHIERTGTAAEGWLFYTGDGRPIPPSTVNSWWQSTTKAAETPALHLHGLRHFYASGLIAAGCDVVTVQRALGHRSPSTTLDTYSHLWPSAEDRTRAGAASLTDLVLGAAADSVRTQGHD
jgi:integrase